jgi:hypothetical protein
MFRRLVMKVLKTALLAGVLASASTMAFAQGGGATAGVNFDSLYQTQAYSTGNASYARAGQQVRTRAVNHTTIQQRGRAYTTGNGVGSPD